VNRKGTIGGGTPIGDQGREQMAGRVENKVAIVTGAGTGIGQGIACLLAREGARVVVANRNAETGEETVQQIREAGGEARFQRTDVTRESDCAELVRTTVALYGGLDVLVNNAGIFPRATLEKTTEELWDRIMAVNLKGVFFCCKHAVPAMRARGHGSIVNIGSANSYIGGTNLFAYSVSKGALLTLTRNLARAHGHERIRVNFVNPGWVVTPGEIEVQAREGHDVDWLNEQGARKPLGRLQEPEDAAYAVLYLASDESSQVTGEALNVDGGSSMR
jgi:NAD(P)-dependent dehydrogenase (short-subunit alcohol dehydrogenase family)